MTDAAKSCCCGEPDCWDADDFSWLASESGWHGTLGGCESSVFFIHGKKIREQRHIPAGYYRVEELPALITQWSSGLPNAMLVWSDDTGDGDAGLWIEGVREPTTEDWARRDAVRERETANARKDYERLKRQFEPAPARSTGGA